MNNPYLLCPNFKGIARAYDAEKSLHLVAQLRCKMWSCEFCAAQNSLQWRAAITHYIANGGESVWSFHTFTMPAWVHRAATTPDEKYELSCGLIRKNWDKLQKRLKREYGNYQYVRVVEQHASGVAHIHYLASFHADDIRAVVRDDGSLYHYSPKIKGHANDCGFGYIIDNRNITESDKAAFHVGKYITKYMTKDLGSTDDTRKKYRIRKIQTSRGIKRVNLGNSLEWALKSGLIRDEWEESSFEFFDVTRGKFIDEASFMGGIVYPPLIDASE